MFESRRNFFIFGLIGYVCQFNGAQEAMALELKISPFALYEKVQENIYWWRSDKIRIGCLGCCWWNNAWELVLNWSMCFNFNDLTSKQGKKKSQIKVFGISVFSMENLMSSNFASRFFNLKSRNYNFFWNFNIWTILYLNRYWKHQSGFVAVSSRLITLLRFQGL